MSIISKWKRLQCFIGGCVWEHRTRKGEEEHGSDIGIRYCKHCDRKQYAYYVSDIKWRDENEY